MVGLIRDNLRQVAGVTGRVESLHSTSEYDLESRNRDHGHCRERSLCETLHLPVTMIPHFTCGWLGGQFLSDRAFIPRYRKCPRQGSAT
jgi:hypothetical protein